MCVCSNYDAVFSLYIYILHTYTHRIDAALFLCYTAILRASARSLLAMCCCFATAARCYAALLTVYMCIFHSCDFLSALCVCFSVFCLIFFSFLSVLFSVFICVFHCYYLPCANFFYFYSFFVFVTLFTSVFPFRIILIEFTSNNT